MDGAIDYRAFTDQQLQEALQTIDRDRFPLNYSRLTTEVQRRRLKSSADTSSPSVVAKEPIWHQHPLSDITRDTTPVPLWKYVCLFAVIYYAGVILAGTVLEYFAVRRASSVGTAIILVAALVVGRRFAARHKRIFTSQEAHRLMFYCLLVVGCMEVFVVLFHPDLQDALSPRGLIVALMVAVAWNAIVIWGAYRFIARKDMQTRLKTITPGAA